MTRESFRLVCGSVAVVAISLLVTISVFSGETKLSADELVTKHLDSIGTQEARSAVKSLVAQGTVAFNERSRAVASG